MRFCWVGLRDSLLRRKDRAYVINLDDEQIEWTDWVSLFIGKDTAAYLYVYCFSSWIYSSKSIKKSKTNQSLTTYTEHNLMILLCVHFIASYRIAEGIMLYSNNLFSPDDYQKNSKIIYMYFKDKYGQRKRKPWH